MIGIYKITNLLTNQSYIGQSKDIEQRFKEHLYHKKSNIDSDIHKYGSNNFSFDVLEECTENELDDKEDYYIQLYNSINNGYNQVRGGQHNIGESNSNVKLTEQDVYDIREAYKNHESKKKTYEKYSDKIEWYYFSNLWEGKSWLFIHMDVYTDENKSFYNKRYYIEKDSKKPFHRIKNVFSDEEIMKYRKMYQYMTPMQIYEKENIKKCNFKTFIKILHGESYKRLPYYSKSKGKWINN